MVAWRLLDLAVLVFGAVILAVLLRGLAGRLERATGIPEAARAAQDWLSSHRPGQALLDLGRDLLEPDNVSWGASP